MPQSAAEQVIRTFLELLTGLACTHPAVHLPKRIERRTRAVTPKE